MLISLGSIQPAQRGEIYSAVISLIDASKIRTRLFRTSLLAMIASTITSVRAVIAKTQKVISHSSFIRETDQDALAARSTKNVRRISIVALSCFVTQPQACAKSRSKSDKSAREKTSVSTMLPVPSVNARGMAESSMGSHLIPLWHVLVVLLSRFDKTRGTHCQLIGVITIPCCRIARSSAMVRMMSACIRPPAPSRWISTLLANAVSHRPVRASAQQLIKNHTQRIWLKSPKPWRLDVTRLTDLISTNVTTSTSFSSKKLSEAPTSNSKDVRKLMIHS